MLKKIQFSIAIIIFIFLISCKSSIPDTFPNSENEQYRIPDSVNTKMNRQFVKSRKSFVGIIETKELEKLYDSMERSLKIKLNREKSVLVNYKQRGTNCFDYNYESLIAVMGNIKRISNRMSNSYDIQDFFMFSERAYNRDVYENTGHYLEDTGFFKDNIFSLEEVCDAFFLVKPNGEFLKFYGGDYFSEVSKFMESKLIFTQN